LYKAETNKLTRQTKDSVRQTYDWQRKIDTNTLELDRIKTKSTEMMSAIQVAKSDPDFHNLI